MKVLTSLIAAAGFTAAAFSAQAADLPSRKGPPLAPMFLAYNWSGFYFGLNAGASFNDSRLSSNIVDGNGYFAATSIASIHATSRRTADDVSFIGGAQIGYNIQFNQFVVGAEADFNYLGARESFTSTVVYPCCAPTTYTLSQSAKTEWLGTLRLRAGLAFDRLLIYATGGLAFGEVKVAHAFSDTFNPVPLSTASGSDTKFGWTLGGGLEYALTNNWTIKGEYLYVDLGKVRTNAVSIDPVVLPLTTIATTVNARHHIARIGINYKF